jgi:Protein of unknown function (DUF3431)
MHMPVSVRIVTSLYHGASPEKSWGGYSRHLERAHIHCGVPVLVYEKDDSLPFMTSVPTERAPPGGGQIIRLDNTGSCDYAFLYHIYTNYDNLDDVTIFTKVNVHMGGIPDDAFQSFVREADLWDYSDVGAFPIRGAWNLTLDYKNQQYLEFMYEEPSKRHPMWQRSSDWYDHIFGGQPFPSTTIDVWGHGPCFAVSRDLIRRHPRSVYKYLMETYLSPYNRTDDKWGVNPTHDLFLRFWKVLFTHGVNSRVKPVPHSSIEAAPGPLPYGVEWVSSNPDSLHLRVIKATPI